MGLPVLKVESQNELSDDERKAERVASRLPATHRRAFASVFRCPINRAHRPVYSGSLLHHLLHAIGLALLLSYLFEADSAWTRSIENSAAGERGVHSYRTFCGCWLWNFSAGHARGG